MIFFFFFFPIILCHARSNFITFPQVSKSLKLHRNWQHIKHSFVSFTYLIHMSLCPQLTSGVRVTQWLQRCALPTSLPAVRFRAPVGAGVSQKCHLSPLSILEHCNFCVFGQIILPSYASLDSGVNEYLVPHPKWLQDCMLSVELKWHTHEVGPVARR